MKKTLKIVMILSIIFALLSCNVSVLASSIINEVESETKGTNDERNTESLAETQQDIKNTSKLFIKIDLRLPEKNPEFNIVLQHKGKMNQEVLKEYTKSEDGEELYYTFDNLTEGDYSLKINSTNNSYLPYSQEFKVEPGKIIELNLTNGHNTEVDDSTENKIVGVMGIGNVSQNGEVDKIDETDVNAMIDQIEKQEYSETYDLNKDGKVNIIDLSYVMFNRKGNVEAKLLQLLNITAEPKVNEETTDINTENGNIEDILKNNDKYISLAPKEGDISSDNAVEITLDIENTEKLRSNYNSTFNKSRK